MYTLVGLAYAVLIWLAISVGSNFFEYSIFFLLIMTIPVLIVALYRLSIKQNIINFIVLSLLAFVISTTTLRLCFLIESTLFYGGKGLGMGGGLLLLVSFRYHAISFIIATFFVVLYKIIIKIKK